MRTILVLGGVHCLSSGTPLQEPGLLPRQSWGFTENDHGVGDHLKGVRKRHVHCGNLTQPTIFTGRDKPNDALLIALTFDKEGDSDDGGFGVVIHDLDYTNRDQEHYYFFYENGRDNHPWKYTLVCVNTSKQCVSSPRPD